MKSTIRFCKDIGMFSYDRSREFSCVHKTGFCEQTCFNEKLEKAFGHAIGPKDIRNDAYWLILNGRLVKKDLARKRNQTKRVRLMTRGEAFKTAQDVYKVMEICQENPNTIFWIPTRAWRDKGLRSMIETTFALIPNARILASLDPSNTVKEVVGLKARGWSTMYYGDDNATQDRYKCPKTHNHATGHCAKCIKGCFSEERVDVHLKQH